MNKSAAGIFASLILICIGLVTGCGPSPAAENTLQPTALPCSAIQNGLAFLNARYNPDLGLLNEAPNAAPDIYWLTNDNALAAFTLTRLGDTTLSGQLQDSLERYGYATNGLIEVVWGTPVSFPPLAYQQTLITTVGPDKIKHEIPINEQPMADWAEYANLAFLGILNQNLQGHTEDARHLYQDTLLKFDGVGFRDKSFQGRYETYKVAMALYAGKVIGAPNAAAEQMREVLLSMQTGEGGFITHYRDQKTPDGDANTETTSWALLALHEAGCAGE